jgi:hypothetical protein
VDIASRNAILVYGTFRVRALRLVPQCVKLSLYPLLKQGRATDGCCPLLRQDNRKEINMMYRIECKTHNKHFDVKSVGTKAEQICHICNITKLRKERV